MNSVIYFASKKDFKTDDGKIFRFDFNFIKLDTIGIINESLGNVVESLTKLSYIANNTFFVYKGVYEGSLSSLTLREEGWINRIELRVTKVLEVKFS